MSILESADRSVIYITHNITHSFHTSLLVCDRTKYIADIAAGKTGYRPSVDACPWTAADADAKISVSTHLCVKP